MTVIWMWAHSRSASTAFGRMMIERGDVTVVHEPLLALTQAGQVEVPAPDGGRVRARSERELLTLLAATGRARPVFVKEVLDYRYPYLIDHPDEIAGMTHTFIVRDPRQAISSHYAMKPTVTCPEIGYQRLHELFELTWSVTGRKPLVIRAEALVGEPAAVVRGYCEAVGLPYLPEALRWQPSDRPEWQRHRAWHLDAIASAGFEDRKHAYPVNVDNNDTLKAFYRYHYPFYRSIVQHAIGTGASMTADTFSPPADAAATAATGPTAQGAGPSPGTVFARAFAADGERTEVSFDYTITDAHKPAREKPRLTVRSLLKKRPVDADEITFWREGRPTEEDAAAVPAAAGRREAGFRFGVAQAQIRPIRAWLQLPPELTADPEMLAEFIDHRLLVRLATAENQALSIGPYGLLSHPEIARLPYHGDYVDGLLAACDEIEQTGSTAHAIIVNPRDYYRVLVGHGSLLADLAANGILISRIRWVRPGQALAGDFAEAVRLLDARRSAIRVAEPPPGTFAHPGLAVCAEINEGLAVHLPTHFFLAVPAGETEANG